MPVRSSILHVLSVVVALLSPAAVVAQARGGAEMIRVPAGAFLMGSNNGPEDERPQHRLEVAEFFSERTKVTNAQFARFLNTAGAVGPQGEKYFDIDDSGRRI